MGKYIGKDDTEEQATTPADQNMNKVLCTHLEEALRDEPCVLPQ
jgi:hypothetical protein